MLLELVERTCADIEKLNISVGTLQGELLKNAQDTIADLAEKSREYGDRPPEDKAAATVAIMLFGVIRTIPPVARQMVQKLGDQRVSAVRRFATAGALAYLVQKRDWLPDDAPGGYGYLDDAIVLRAGLLEYLQTLPQFAQSVESETKFIQLLIGLTPAPVRATLQQAISKMSLEIQLMSLVEGPIAELMLARLIANPLQPELPAQPQGFVPRFTPGYAGYRSNDGHFSGGAWFEGNNVVMPGGPALIDGNLFIPD
jgi:uncharacterized membrane protein YkvA (DUF1232 family)